MIEIKIGEDVLDLNENTRILWRQRNPFFSEDAEYEVDNSLPFDLPYTDKNKRVLGQPERTSSKKSARTFSCFVKLGNTIIYGQLNVFDFGGTYKVSITYDSAKIDMDQKLRELEEVETFSHDKTEWNDYITKTSPEIPYAVPMLINKNEEIVEEYKGVNGKMAINFTNGADEEFNNEEVVVPYFTLYYLLTKFLPDNGYSFKGNFLQSDVLHSTLIYNNNHLTEAPPDYSFYMEIEVGGIPPPGAGSGGLLVTLINTADYLSESGSVITFKIYRHTTAAGNALSGTETISHTITGSEATDPDLLMTGLKATINANINFTFILEKTGSYNYMYFVPSGSFYFSLTSELRRGEETSEPDYDLAQTTYSYEDVVITNHLPDMTVGEMVRGVKSFFNLAGGLDVKDNKISLNFRKDLVNSNYMDMTERVSEEPILDIDAVPNYFLLFTRDSDDLENIENIAHANNYPEHTAKPISNIEIDAIDIPEKEEVYSPMWDVSYEGTYNIPVVNQSMGRVGDVLNSCSLRFLKYIGELTNSNGDAYFTANNDGLTPNEVYANYYEAWYSRMKADDRDFTYMMKLPESFVMQFNKRTKWLIEQNGFIWKEIITPFNMKSIENSKVILMKD